MSPRQSINYPLRYRTLRKAEAYAMKHAYGETPCDDTDDDSDIDDDTKQKLEMATPHTRKRLKSEIDEHRAGKIGPVKTFFTLIKGFVAAGVLFLPKGWRNGGWLFSTGGILLSCVFTTIAALKLLEVRKKYKLSFSEIGYQAYGLPGKIAVDFFLALTQMMFVCAYIPFIANSVNNILISQFRVAPVNDWLLGLACFIVFVPLVWVRKIEKFSFFHIFADIAILIGVITIIVYATIELADNHGHFAQDTQLINPKTFLSFIGLAAYIFEGIGIIIPVMETTTRPDLYPYIVILVISSLTLFYIFFGNYLYFIYGSERLGEHPMITDVLPSKDIAVAAIQVIWVINLIFTYPLVIHPSNMVIESYIYKGWVKSRKRTWMKNITRSLLVAFTIALSIYLMDTLDKLESLNGAFACIPIAFLLPALFHYKLVAETRREKIVDLVVVALSLALMVVCTVVTFIFWNE